MLFVIEMLAIISLMNRSNSKASKDEWEVLTNDYEPIARANLKITGQMISVESNGSFVF